MNLNKFILTILALTSLLIAAPAKANYSFEELEKQSCATQENLELAFDINRKLNTPIKTLRTWLVNPDHIEEGFGRAEDGYTIWGDEYEPVVRVDNYILFSKKTISGDLDEFMDGILRNNIFETKGYKAVNLSEFPDKTLYDNGNFILVQLFKKGTESKYITVAFRTWNPTIFVSAPSPEAKWEKPSFHYDSANPEVYPFPKFDCAPDGKLIIWVVEAANFISKNNTPILGFIGTKLILDETKKPAPPSINSPF